MSVNLAKKVLTDIPVTQLQQIVSGIEALPKTLSVATGGFCGCGCGGSEGAVCGFDCAGVTRATVGIVDQTNKAGITKTELTEARSKVMGFKDTLLSQARISGIPLK
ncbi:MAG: hypothetical protein ACYCZF_15445 [Anaerolineae bacterium]